MKTKHVKRNVDLKNPPALTSAQRARLSTLAKRPGREIDYSDIPPLTDAFWKNGPCRGGAGGYPAHQFPGCVALSAGGIRRTGAAGARQSGGNTLKRKITKAYLISTMPPVFAAARSNVMVQRQPARADERSIRQSATSAVPSA